MKLLILSFLPVSVAVAFLIHWVNIRELKTSQERLVISRGVYIGFSAQLLLYAWGLSVVPSRLHGLPFAALAMTFSLIGDVCNLQFAGVRKIFSEPLYPGIGAFVVAQIFYLGAVLQVLPLEVLFAGPASFIILAGFLLVPAVLFYFRIYNAARPRALMISAFLYGELLCLLVALYVNAALARGGYWWLVAAGGLIFLLSDSQMGETTIHGGRHPATEYQIPWFTYLVAQGLLILGFFLVGQISS